MIFCAFAVKVFFQTPSELIFVPESKRCGIIHFDHFRPTERVCTAYGRNILDDRWYVRFATVFRLKIPPL